jgi:hypothetical protein
VPADGGASFEGLRPHTLAGGTNCMHAAPLRVRPSTVLCVAFTAESQAAARGLEDCVWCYRLSVDANGFCMWLR